MIILKAENISKQYRLGLVGTGTLSHDLNRLWYRLRGKEDPYSKVGAVNDRSTKAEEEYVWALRDINFEVQQGEVLGIIGKNGAGKSTLLKILSRVTGPTTGSIKTKGRIASLLEVGTGFHPELTGRENIYLNGAILGMTKTEIAAKEDEIIDFSGCNMYIDTPVKRYSSGMRVRLGFAVAAFLEPDILVVDEVLAVGDAEFQKKAIGKMQDISKGEGRTVLFVSHNMASVKNLCTRVIVLENGVSVYEGDTIDGVDFYLNNANDNKKGIKEKLINRKDRLGDGSFKFTNIRLSNKEGLEVVHCISGQYLKVEMFYKAFKSFQVDKFIFAFAIFDLYGNKITGLSSIESGMRLSRINKEGIITWEIPNLLLREGRYFLTIHASYNTAEPNDYLDVVENACEIQVLPGDFWNTSTINRKGNDMILPSKVY
ncbi:ABC transporter ATP-binding protein [Marixanthomonas sp. SCSIO 43207]|uniref:ABC transporter ATP-binding protein n=1 Tax=Marixanthomonas sp. SCSIO 43207 TaxID=2779360 RepID=UPI001CA7C4E2|nr:ABC transporter ATP-binding protein [Marixanthomonas sp. SCSIO 43207]UAB81239.1 ABC transporter ATP-binding protein [Marixanthomonas sp. SCSIO 43207]